MSEVIHYAGRVVTDNGTMLAGWAACCSGRAAISIRERGDNTHDRGQVTCKRCLLQIERNDQRAARIEAEERDGH